MMTNNQIISEFVVKFQEYKEKFLVPFIMELTRSINNDRETLTLSIDINSSYCEICIFDSDYDWIDTTDQLLDIVKDTIKQYIFNLSLLSERLFEMSLELEV